MEIENTDDFNPQKKDSNSNIAKLAYDSAHVQTGDPSKDFLFWCIIFLFCIATTLALNYFEMRSELLR